MLGLGLGIGLCQNVAATGGGGAAWTPASLPGIKLWVEADPTKLYTDAGTTLVSADGQSVQQANDKSGNAHHLLQATSGSRPLYRTGSGKPYLQFDGTDDFLSAAAYTATDGSGFHYVGVAIDQTAAPGLTMVAELNGVAPISWLRINGGNSEFLVWDNATSTFADDTGAAVALNTPLVLIGTISGGGTEVFVDNVSGGSTSNPTTVQTNNASLFVAAKEGSTNFMTGRVYGIVQGTGALSSGDRSSLQTYLAALHP